ncbi:hypothetical protein HanPI659440_Chr05g0205771 [Helianthus annuus]|nr:hypothetical protein HanPI659440_Chr05g0205771 [Helianthus annuus]
MFNYIHIFKRRTRSLRDASIGSHPLETITKDRFLICKSLSTIVLYCIQILSLDIQVIRLSRDQRSIGANIVFSKDK